MTTTKTTKTTLREKLLPRTIEHASAIPFYRELWAGIDLATIRRVPDLASLPTVDKARHRDGLERAHHPDRLPSVLLHSGGTSGRPFVRYRSDEEIAALRHYFRTLTTGAADGEVERSRIVFSTLGASYHGNAVTVTDDAFRVAIRVTDEGGLQQALALVTATDLFPGRTITTRQLHGNPPDLLVLAGALSNAVADVPSLGISAVVSVGDHLTARAREFLVSTFGPSTAIVDRFTASEIGAGATRCPACGAYHVDAHIIPEVVDIDSHEPVTSGRGLFVATELYPFSQFQPLVRYSTRDVVEVVEPDCDKGELSFTYVGRLDGSPTVEIGGRTHLLAAMGPLTEAIERLPNVRRRPLGRVRVSEAAASLGSPLFSVDVEEEDGDKLRVVVRVEVDGAADLEGIRRSTEAAALSTAPDLDALVRAGQAQLRVETVTAAPA